MIESMLKNNNDEKNQFFIDYIIHDIKDKDHIEKNLKERKNISHQLIENNIRYHVIDHLDFWMRDNGPIFVIDRQAKQRKIIDFGFTNWTYYKSNEIPSIIEEAVDRKIANLINVPLIRSSIISEGGDREFNGDGVLMMVEHVEMQRNRENNFENREQLEWEMKRVFGKSASKIIWLETEGLVDDQCSYRGKIPGTNFYGSYGTGGHIDEWCRFVDEKTIMLAYVPDFLNDCISVENRRRLEQNYELLKKATNVRGEPFTIIRVPVAPHVIHDVKKGDSVFDTLQEMTFEDGSVIHPDETIQFIIASSYLNFLVTNNTVLVAKYYREGLPQHVKETDEQVLKLFESVYPDRQIVQISTEALNMGGGGMHCITNQMPLLN